MAASVTVIGCVQADVVMSPVTEIPQPGATQLIDLGAHVPARPVG